MTLNSIVNWIHLYNKESNLDDKVRDLARSRDETLGDLGFEDVTNTKYFSYSGHQPVIDVKRKDNRYFVSIDRVDDAGNYTLLTNYFAFDVPATDVDDVDDKLWSVFESHLEDHKIPDYAIRGSVIGGVVGALLFFSTYDIGLAAGCTALGFAAGFGLGYLLSTNEHRVTKKLTRKYRAEKGIDALESLAEIEPAY